MATQHRTSFEIESIELKSERLAKTPELRSIVTDLEIFEHIQKPYLTARMLLVDDSNFYQEADIFGSEKIIIKIKSTEDGSKPITKTFFIDHIEKQQKIHDNAQVMSIHLVEDIVYISCLKNINRHYSGKPSEIIKKIARTFLSKQVFSTGGINANFVQDAENPNDTFADDAVQTDFTDQQNIRCIIPNLHPIEALQWLTARASTVKGYPFYMYSTLIDSHFILEDLGAILLKESLNLGNDAKFVASSTKASTMDVASQRRIIKNHEFSPGSENLLQIIENGLVSADYEYIDTLTENTRKFKYNSKKDLFQKLIDDNILSRDQPGQPGQPNPGIHFGEKIDGKSFDEHTTNYITKIGGSNVFRTQPEIGNIDWTNSYGETKNAAEYKLKVVKASMDAMVKKNPVTINVDGIEFLKGDFNKTIGNNIDVIFLATLNESTLANEVIDKKKSGKYLIYSARHMFKQTVEKYDIALNLIKIGNLKKGNRNE